jgi:hypothetical protein
MLVPNIQGFEAVDQTVTFNCAGRKQRRDPGRRDVAAQCERLRVGPPERQESR